MTLNFGQITITVLLHDVVLQLLDISGAGFDGKTYSIRLLAFCDSLRQAKGGLSFKGRAYAMDNFFVYLVVTK